jgi:hypothetical protein
MSIAEEWAEKDRIYDPFGSSTKSLPGKQRGKGGREGEGGEGGGEKGNVGL